MNMTDEMVEIARKAAGQINGGSNPYFVILGAFAALSVPPAGVTPSQNGLLIRLTEASAKSARLADAADRAFVKGLHEDGGLKNMSAIEPAGVGVETVLPSSLMAGGQHPDDLAVENFAAAMKSKLAKKREQGFDGWHDPIECPIDYLAALLVEQIQRRPVLDPVDIANLSMMIHERGETPDYGR